MKIDEIQLIFCVVTVLRWYLTSLLSFVLMLPIYVRAEEVRDSYIDDEKDEKEMTLEERLIQGNKEISEWFDSTADEIDLFLVGSRRITKKKNLSAFRIENTTVSTEGSDPTNKTSFNINLRLPNVERYWAVKFTSYDEQEENRGIRKSYLKQGTRQKNYGATVGLFKKLGKVRTSFEPRIELQDPLKVSHSLTFESVASYKTYRIKPEIEFFASPTKGVGTFQALNFSFFLTKVYTLNLINQGEYQERTYLYSVTNGISLGQMISKKQSMAYTLIFDSNNEPNYHLQGYNVSVAWSEILYQRILDYQVIPNVDFNRIRNYKPLLGLTVVLNLNF